MQEGRGALDDMRRGDGTAERRDAVMDAVRERERREAEAEEAEAARKAQNSAARRSWLREKRAAEERARNESLPDTGASVSLILASQKIERLLAM